MIKKHFALIFVPIFLVLSGCAGLFITPHREGEMERLVRDGNIRWKGESAYALIKQMGRADRMDSDETGGYILVWIEQMPVKTPIYEHYAVKTNQNNTSNTQNYYIPQNKTSETRGEMKWNPFLEQWEWKSNTTTRNSNSILDAVIQGQKAAQNTQKSFSDTLVENRTRVVGYSTSYRILELRFYVNSNDIIYLFNIKERN